ncbi:hypothetical protein V8E54_005021 [Elaphomyces granulatus]
MASKHPPPDIRCHTVGISFGPPMVAEHARRNLHFLLVQGPELEAGDYEKAIAKALQGEDSILEFVSRKLGGPSGSTEGVFAWAPSTCPEPYIGDLQYKNPINTFDIQSKPKTRKSPAKNPELRGNFLSCDPHLKTVSLSPDSRYVLVCSTDEISDSTDDQPLIERVIKRSNLGARAVEIAQGITVNSRRDGVVAFIDGTNS